MTKRDEGAKLRGAPGPAEAPGGTGHMNGCRQDHVRKGYASAAPAAPPPLPFGACPLSLPLPFDNRISSANFLFSLRTEVLPEAFVAAGTRRSVPAGSGFR
jgi:hypothetical protein